MRLFVGEETDGKTCREYRNFQSNSTIEKVVRLLLRKIRHFFSFLFSFFDDFSSLLFVFVDSERNEDIFENSRFILLRRVCYV